MLRACSFAGVTQIVQRLQRSVIEITFDRLNVLQHLFANDDHLWLYQRQAVQQHVATLTGVDHGGNGTELDDGQYRNQGFRTVLKNHGNHITAADALRGQIMRDLVRFTVYLIVGVSHIFVADSDVFWALACVFLQQKSD